MDESTALHYATNAASIAARYEAVTSAVAAYFPIAFAPGCKVLDVGAGSGRDLAQLLKQGYDAYGIEPTEALRSAAVQHHPGIEGRLADGALPEIGDAFGSDFDGILCSAVLMHVPESELFDTAFSFRRMLRPHGRLLLSLPQARDDVDVDDRDSAGRLFKPYTAEYLQLLFERIGFQLIGRWDTDDALGRSGTRWYTLLLELRSGGPLRAVDQIEGILNRDRKVATYKLALFRALAEIAMQEPRVARWTSDARVGVPVSRVAERWLFYYWPIFAAERFVPLLWGNNDLWNLLPVDERVNGQKADKLPSDVLLRDRRLTVIGNWSMLRDQVPDAFARQGAHLLGRPIGGPLNWEDDLFTRLCEAVELTALQRGVERWYPRP